LSTASGPSEIAIEGGTHNDLAPPFDFLERVYLPLLERMGPKVEVCLDRFGFYPAGGGSFEAKIEPSEKLAPIELAVRGELSSKKAVAIVANLPRNIAERELSTVRERLGWDGEATTIVETKNSVGPGNIVMLEVVSTALTEIFSAFGKLGKSSQSV